MALIDRVRETIEQQSRASLPIQPVTGGTGFQTGQPPAYADYLATSNDFFSAANLRAKSVAKLPWQIEEADGTTTNTGQILDLLNRPNPHISANKLRRLTELAMCVWAEYFWVLERGPSGLGRPREIWPVPPTVMKAVPHPTEFLAGFILTLPGGQEIPFTPDEVVWFIQPDPKNLFQPLTPLAAARLAADTARGSQQTNRNLFDNGLMGGGYLLPPGEQQAFETGQAQELEREIDKRFRGVGKAHRWAVMTRQFKMLPMNITPKDAQFIEGMKASFRQVCRALGVQPELLADNENATLANVQQFERALWEHTITDEVNFIGGEVTRQLGPAFGDRRVSMDLSDVVALQDDETLAWEREAGQLDRGAITINEWRTGQGRDPVDWGEEPWLQRLVRQPGDPDPLGASEPERSARTFREDEYQEHEDAIRDIMLTILGRQEDAVLRKLRQRTRDSTVARTAQEAAANPFDLTQWTDRTADAVEADVEAIVAFTVLLERGGLAMTDEEVALALENRTTQAAIRAQVTRLSEDVTATTYRELQETLAKGIQNGETTKQLTARVEHTMGVRKDKARQIAVSEVTRATTTGQIAAYTIAGVAEKRWVTRKDGSVRESHQALEGATVGVTENFQIGACSGTGPGRSGCADEDINCRCTLTPVLVEPAASVGNGFVRVNELGMKKLLATLEHV